jgi:hypothetical protein
MKTTQLLYRTSNRTRSLLNLLDSVKHECSHTKKLDMLFSFKYPKLLRNILYYAYSPNIKLIFEEKIDVAECSSKFGNADSRLLLFLNILGKVHKGSMTIVKARRKINKILKSSNIEECHLYSFILSQQLQIGLSFDLLNRRFEGLITDHTTFVTYPPYNSSMELDMPILIEPYWEGLRVKFVALKNHPCYVVLESEENINLDLRKICSKLDKLKKGKDIILEGVIPREHINKKDLIYLFNIIGVEETFIKRKKLLIKWVKKLTDAQYTFKINPHIEITSTNELHTMSKRLFKHTGNDQILLRDPDETENVGLIFSKFKIIRSKILSVSPKNLYMVCLLNNKEYKVDIPYSSLDLFKNPNNLVGHICQLRQMDTLIFKKIIRV